MQLTVQLSGPTQGLLYPCWEPPPHNMHKELHSHHLRGVWSIHPVGTKWSRMIASRPATAWPTPFTFSRSSQTRGSLSNLRQPDLFRPTWFCVLSYQPVVFPVFSLWLQQPDYQPGSDNLLSDRNTGSRAA